MKAVKLLLGVIIFVCLEYITIIISRLVPFIADHKQNFIPDPITHSVITEEGLFTNFLIDTVLHPINSIRELIQTNNPLFYILSVVAFVLTLYIVLAKKDSGYLVGHKYGVHGSSRWGNQLDISNKKELKLC